jgi:hypothetical protein
MNIMDAFAILGGPDVKRGRGRPRKNFNIPAPNRGVGRPNLYGENLSLKDRMKLAQQKFQAKKRVEKEKETLRLKNEEIRKKQILIRNREKQKELEKQQRVLRKGEKDINRSRNEIRYIPTLPIYIGSETIEKASGNIYINHIYDTSNTLEGVKYNERVQYIAYYIHNLHKPNNNYKYRYFLKLERGIIEKTTIDISTSYETYLQVINSLIDQINVLGEQYEAFGKVIQITFTELRPNQAAGASSHKSVQQANNIWYMMNKKTRTNCAYTASYICCHPDKIEDFLNNPQIINNHAIDLKRRVNPYKKQYADGEELQQLSTYLKRTIILYNNIYQQINIFEYVNPDRKKRTAPRDSIELQLKDNHYIALIRKKSIQIDNEKFMEKLEKKEERMEKYNQKCKRIVKIRKYEDLNTKIAVWDIETFCYIDRGVKCYAVGFAMYKNNEEYYISFWGLDAQFQFFEFLYYNRSDLNEYTLYAHNGGKFDIMNALREYLLNSDKWTIDNNIELNGSFICLKIKSSDGFTIKFLDSNKMLAGSLEKLTKDFRVKHQKLVETVNHNDINEHNYNDIPELKPYLKNDCLGLLEVMTSFNQTVYDMTFVDEKYFSKVKNDTVHNVGGLNMTNFLTGATLAKQYWWNRHYNPYDHPIYTNTDEIDDFIRKSYYGGRVEISQLGIVEKKLYYLDFTSLYPATGCYDLPYGDPVYINFNNCNKLPDSFFGFVKCLVKTKCNKRRPLHGDKSLNKLCFRIHEKWEEMTLFSEEVRYGVKIDMYDYQFIEGYNQQRAPIMKKVFEECFEKKATSKSEGKFAMAQAWKIILNSLYGFWGLRTKDRDSVKIYPKGDSPVFDYLQNGKLINESDIGNYTILRVLNDLEIKDFNVGIASAIASYGRIRLTNLIHDIEDKNYKVYMNDTDSIITDCNISKYQDLMLNYMWDGCGDELGSLKNEADEKMEKVIKGKETDYLPIELAIVYNYSDKETKDKLNKLAISQIAKKEGGLLYFDRGIFCGCKFYTLEKDFEGVKIDITKCKGYKQTNKDNLNFTDMKKLTVNTQSTDENDFEYFDMYNNHLEQNQMQFRIPKCNMLSESDAFKYTIPSINKTFKQTYTKGYVDSSGVVTPLINK